MGPLCPEVLGADILLFGVLVPHQMQFPITCNLRGLKLLVTYTINCWSYINCLLRDLQVLLVASAGSMTRSLPVLAIAYWSILIAWLSAVDRLSNHHVGAFT